ncbi:hypothetical protein DFV88_24815 [Salmonella enterica subsp. enterica serovar Newport]|nr:hypothetical protein [Salmonella enterica subsp. enterica serovar Newport]
MMNQQYNPIAPEMGATADQMMDYFRTRAAAARGEAQQNTAPAYNPYQPEENKADTQGQHVANMEQWLSPVKMDNYDQATQYTDDKHENFLENLQKCPAVKEYGDQLHAGLQQAQALFEAGRIDAAQRDQIGQDLLENVVKPSLNKHLKKDSTANSYHRKQEPEIPEIVKKIRGVK